MNSSKTALLILLSASMMIPSYRMIYAQKAGDDERKKLEEMEQEIADIKKRLDDVEDKTEKSSDRYKLNVSGFFDMNMSNYREKPNVFEIGTFEIQMLHEYPQNIFVAAALVFNKKGASLGVGIIDYHLFGSTISPRGKLFHEKGIHLQVGKFDVPFGNDWQYFSDADRITVTPPLTTEKIMNGGYNDVGSRLIVNMVWFNSSIHVLRGIDQGYSYGGNSIGGRIGLTPLNDPYSLSQKSYPLELGFSYLHDLDKQGATAEKLFAGDLDIRKSRFLLLSEYYRRDKTIGMRYTGTTSTAGFDIKEISTVVYSRYDIVRSERYKAVMQDGTLSRVSCGFRYSIHDIAYVKAEYSHYIKRTGIADDDEYFTKNLYYLQLMVRF
jgi:hypothetical protein